MNNQSGFSLLELIVCMVVLATLSLITFPAIGSWRDSARLRSEVLSLVSSMQKAKIEAIAKNSPVVVQFDINGKQYSMFVDNGAGDGIAEDWICQEDEQLLGMYVMSEGISLASTTFHNRRMRFNPTVGVMAGRFVIQDKNGLEFGVVVSRLGRIRVEKK